MRGSDRPLHPTLAAPRWRWAWLLLAYLALILAAIGVLLPGLPTTPFVLLAAFAAARGSRRLHDWLLGHRLFGPMIADWEGHGAVGRRAKWSATIAMAVCAALMFWLSARPWLAAVGTGTMAIVGVWLWRRPEPPATGSRPAD